MSVIIVLKIWITVVNKKLIFFLYLLAWLRSSDVKTPSQQRDFCCDGVSVTDSVTRLH